MYPQLINQASRLAPMLSRAMARGGSFATPFWKASQVDAPGVNATPVPPGSPYSAVRPPISGDNSAPANYSAGASPQDRLNATFKSLPEMAQNNNVPSPLDTMNWPFGPVGAPTQAPASAATAGVPLPTARPAEAPQAPEDTGFFMRNALMQQDPLGGGFIDPTGAASVSGPDLISKMMGYLNRKV